MTTLNGVRSVAPWELLVTLITKYSSIMAAEFLGLLFLRGEFDRLCGLLVEGELVDFFISLGDGVWELEGAALVLEWDEQTLEWASRS